MEIAKIGIWTRGLQGDDCYQVIREGLEMGYAHIDTASHYQNEEMIWKAVCDSAIPREKVWITTKIWRDDYEKIQEACDESLQRLKTDYLDLLLLHWPTNRLEEHRRIFEQLLVLQQMGKVKKIWVSNFTISQIQDLLSFFGCEIFANEIEYHPCLDQEKMRSFCDSQGIKVIAYSPLGHGNLLHLPSLQQLASKIGISCSQLCIAYLLQKWAIVIPKTRSKQRLQENLLAQNLVLSDEVMETLEQLPKHYRYINPPFAPQWD